MSACVSESLSAHDLGLLLFETESFEPHCIDGYSLGCDTDGAIGQSEISVKILREKRRWLSLLN
jgi:hypothetical protein